MSRRRRLNGCLKDIHCKLLSALFSFFALSLLLPHPTQSHFWFMTTKTYGKHREAISKLISPTPAALAAANANSSGDPQRKQTAGNLYYAFVDLPSIEEADAAAAALNGRSMPWGGRVRVNRAKGVSGKLVREQGPGAAGEAKE